MLRKMKQQLKKNEFKCDRCGGIFEKGWSDEEADKEAKQWGKLSDKEKSTICDDCYKDFIKWYGN